MDSVPMVARCWPKHTVLTQQFTIHQIPAHQFPGTGMDNEMEIPIIVYIKIMVILRSRNKNTDLLMILA